MLRVLHGPVNVGNQPWVLSRHERALGVRSDLAVNYSTWFGYPADRCVSALGKRTPLHIAKRFLFGVTSPWRYDVLHYYFGRSFLCWDDYGAPNRLWFADLKLARRLGRKVFMTLQGCDIRLSDESAARNEFTACEIGRCESAPDCRASLDARRRALVRDILPLVHRVFFLNPELGHYVPGASFLPYASVDVEAFEPVWPSANGVPVLLHAPSNESIKGSALIIEAVERLKKRIPLEFVLVKGVPYEQALKLYQRADLVIDQLLMGWYGGLAVEAMAMGKPVACYLRDQDLAFLPAGMRRDLPIVQITPGTVEADLERALRRRHEWPAWGRRSRDYVLRWHHPRRLAAAMIRTYRDPESRFNLEAEYQACAA
jgi:glycosyltransferase involved in cell wall biosynthesis